MRECLDCYFWKQDAETQGHCGIFSVSCITAVFNKTTLTRFLEKTEVTPVSEPKSIGGEDEKKVKGEGVFMGAEYLTSAQRNRQSQGTTYADMRELTDESKKMVRKRRKK